MYILDVEQNKGLKMKRIDLMNVAKLSVADVMKYTKRFSRVGVTFLFNGNATTGYTIQAGYISQNVCDVIYTCKKLLN